MKIVGLTGGIGSGKTTVANFFRELGVPIYTSDEAAKKLMVTNIKLRQKITTLFGEASYKNETLNRKYLSELVFNNSEKLEALNKLVHPVVAEDFSLWVEKQKSPYVIKESALLFETGDYKNCDIIILVKAPLEERIKRVMMRDKTTRENVLLRISHQWLDEKKLTYSDYTIENTSISLTKKYIDSININILNIK